MNQQKNDMGASKTFRDYSPKVRVQSDRDGNVGHSVCYSSRIERGVVGLTLKERKDGGNSAATGLKFPRGPLEDCTNLSVGKSVPLRTWKKIARQSQKSNVDKQPSSMDRRSDMDFTKVALNKR